MNTLDNYVDREPLFHSFCLWSQAHGQRQKTVPVEWAPQQSSNRLHMPNLDKCTSSHFSQASGIAEVPNGTQRDRQQTPGKRKEQEMIE